MVSCTAPTKNSEPSGLALAASDAPTVPPAPPLLSTMICWPSWSPTCAARGRQKVSVPPPAGNGLKKTIGPLGQAWARTTAGAASEAARPSLRARRREVLENVIVSSSLNYYKIQDWWRTLKDASELTSQRAAFPADSRADQRARPDPAGDGLSDDRSPRTGVQRAGQEGPAQRAPGLPDQAAGDRLPSVRHRRLGGGVGEYAVGRRSRAHVGDRPLRLAVEEDGRQARHQVRVHGRRLAKARRSGRHRAAPEGRQGPCDQGGVHRAQRDLDRRGKRYRRGAP